MRYDRSVIRYFRFWRLFHYSTTSFVLHRWRYECTCDTRVETFKKENLFRERNALIKTVIILFRFVIFVLFSFLRICVFIQYDTSVTINFRTEFPLWMEYFGYQLFFDIFGREITIKLFFEDIQISYCLDGCSFSILNSRSSDPSEFQRCQWNQM